MLYLILIMCAIVPPIILLLLTKLFDKNRTIPIYVIIVLFLCGMFSCIPIALTEIFAESFVEALSLNDYLKIYMDNFFIVAVCEEFGKFAIMFVATWWDKRFKYKYDSLIYAVATSLGFAVLENILYVLMMQMEYQQGLSTSLGRAFLAIPAHFSFAIIMGYFYGLMKQKANEKSYVKMSFYLFATLFVPMFLHGLYDFLLEIGFNMLFFYAYIILIDFVVAYIIISTTVKNENTERKPFFIRRH